MTIPKIKFNKKYSIEFDKIYAIEVKPWGKIWVKYRENKQNKIVIYKGQVDQLYSIVNQLRVLRGLPPLSPEKEIKSF